MSATISPAPPPPATASATISVPVPTLTPMQKIVTALVGAGHNYSDCAERLGITRATVKFHAEQAAAKIPGDLPTQMKLVIYHRMTNGINVVTGKQA